MIHRWFWNPKGPFFAPLLLTLVFIIGCASSAPEEPTVGEKEVIKDVVVEKEVEKPIVVEKEVVKEVVATPTSVALAKVGPCADSRRSAHGSPGGCVDDQDGWHHHHGKLCSYVGQGDSRVGLSLRHDQCPVV